MASPCFEHGSPVPAIVARPAKKVVGGTGEKVEEDELAPPLSLSSEGANKGSGPHLICVGSTIAPLQSLQMREYFLSLRGLNGPCKTDGRIL